MGFPLVDAVLAKVSSQPSSSADDISGLRVAVQEPDLKYKEFDNLASLPDVEAPVGRRVKEASQPVATAPVKDALAEILTSVKTEAPVEAEFRQKPVNSPSPKSSESDVEIKSQQQSLRDVFAFLAGKRDQLRPASNLSDIFR
ncbi:hypothetical protein JK182_01040 [Acetobacter okinawensis]|uniref:hypothetical protein n=1 Tax=Acetobacter okinawensis TaxID=1076594 RepID=UPI001BAACC17|nr:hypothetical protein [Acetobacter okinawensis]MBS0987276.1 hypothetical protein [Acetobacter okinawensis]